MRVTVFTIIAFASFMTVGGYALAAQATDTTQDASTNDADKVVCKTGRPPLGSRLPGPRECHTQAQWDEMARTAHDELSRNQQKAQTGCLQSIGCGG